MDNIRERGAMDVLMSDHANYEMSARVKDVLRALMIGHWKSEPHHQHQNFAEHRWGHVKANLEWLMAFLDVDPDCWLLALNCACSVMNLTAEKILGWRTPQEVATCETLDIVSCCSLCFGMSCILLATQTSNPVRRRVKRFKDDLLVLPGMSVTSRHSLFLLMTLKKLSSDLFCASLTAQRMR